MPKPPINPREPVLFTLPAESSSKDFIMEEQSVLDYLMERLSLRRLFHPVEPDQTDQESTDDVESMGEIEPTPTYATFDSLSKFPWRSLLALVFALLAQMQFEPPAQNWIGGIVLYTAAAGLLVWALVMKEWGTFNRQEMVETSIGLNVRIVPMFIFIPLIFAAFLAFGGNQFTLLNVTLWVATLAAGLWAFWEPQKHEVTNPIERLRRWLFKGSRPDVWKLLVLGVFLISVFFHFYQLNQIPVNMTSDHTEKLLDINGVLHGNEQIFFSNNGGREPIQFYMAAFLIKLFNTGYSFFTLKLTMALAFLFSLIYVYRLGKELGSQWTGLFFMALLGFSSWANIITRIGLRLVLAPVFIAPVLFYLFRGLRTSQRNDFILAGILTGLGLLGYSAFRVMPLVVLVGVLIFLAYHKFRRINRNTWWALGLLFLFVLVMFLPLLRFSIDYPTVIGFRTITRMTSAERQLPGAVIQVFLSNFWNAAVMPFWKDGSTWVISVPNRPALDLVSAVLYFIGLVLMIFRWLKSRRWQDLFLLVMVPILMMPSILALAFPEENPSLSRAGGAIIPIFLISAIALETLLTSLWKRSKRLGAKGCVVLLGLGLLFFSAGQNFNIALVQYPTEYKNSTWNTTQMGQVAKEFIQSGGSPYNVWVVGVPYWVDTRLVAINAGYVGMDYAIWPKDIAASTSKNSGEKLFFVKADDTTGMNTLKKVYPQGRAILNTSDVQGQEFYAYLVQ
jgi:hypothetical protein